MNRNREKAMTMVIILFAEALTRHFPSPLSVEPFGMIMSLRRGLRLRKKDDATAESQGPLVNRSDKGRADNRRRFPPTVLAAVVTFGVLTISAIALSRPNFENLLKESPSHLRLNPRRQDAADTIILLDGLLALHIPSLDKTKGTIKSIGTPWTLQACPVKHGTSCPDSLDFPVHIQLHISQDSGATLLQAPIWQTTDASSVCGGGRAWRMTPPVRHLREATEIELRFRWFRKACLEGHIVDPWSKSISLNLLSPIDHVSATETTTDSLFVHDAAWQRTASFSKDLPYIWAPITSGAAPTVERLTTTEAFVLPNAIVRENPGYGRVSVLTLAMALVAGYRCILKIFLSLLTLILPISQFSELGNYELLCFFGNQTMGDIRSSFLDIRPQIFKGQRPFKFHFYSIASFERPDLYWDLDKKQRIRKCKHILINVEEFPEPLAQKVYEEKIINLIGHVLRLMNDETFPIRVFTWAESPIGTQNCHSPYLPWSNDHPCNNVLRKLFDTNNPAFPPRVKLLDNSDLTMPDLENTKLMRPYLLAAIALRVFVFVGEQVKIWREAGQMGKVDGLHRNGGVEPNFELVPYEGWGSPL